MAINFYNVDCMEFMQDKPENYYDLAIVDPPYGGGQNFNFRFGTGDSVYKNVAPNEEYFRHLFEISANQIVWGGNYFTYALPVNRCWISWYKGQPIKAFSDFELAWTSFDQTSRSVKIESYGFNHADKRKTGNSTIHPTQKPVILYEWLLMNYAKPGQKILDTHGGSMSIAIAVHNVNERDGMNLSLDVCEIDKDYFDAAVERFNRYTAQTTIFT